MPETQRAQNWLQLAWGCTPILNDDIYRKVVRPPPERTRLAEGEIISGTFFLADLQQAHLSGKGCRPRFPFRLTV